VYVGDEVHLHDHNYDTSEQYLHDVDVMTVSLGELVAAKVQA
jgi:hypothetical protein